MSENNEILSPEDAASATSAPELIESEAHTVTTPVGILMIWFPEEGGTVVKGDAEAVDYLNDALREHTGRMGQSLNLQSIEPIELEDFFDGEPHHITVIPPFESLLEPFEAQDPEVPAPGADVMRDETADEATA